MKALRVNELDNVATAIKSLNKGEVCLDVTLLENIRQGHKFATSDIKQGEYVLKYASQIAVASEDIKKGSWVHIHNTIGARGRGDKDSKALHVKQKAYKKKEQSTSQKTYNLEGYRRSNGTFGLRNHVLVIPSVHCANKVVENVANAVKYGSDLGRDDTNVVYVTHQHGCSELDFDARQTQDVIVGHGANPNVYGVLIVGLGCEVVQANEVAREIKEISPYKEVETLIIQEEGGVKKSIEKGVQKVKKLLTNALKCEKTHGDLSDLVFGTECGGSDSFSGLSANPSLGVASDIVESQGGSVILAETTELIGAEHILATRAKDESIKEQIISTIVGYEQVVLDSKADIRGANPSPGNIEGGLSSIEEKSLGCIYKAGNSPVVDVVKYAKPITKKGLTLMNTPGNDIEQLSGMVAGGCNVCVFTTGRGTPTGSAITPTIKLASNTDTFENMRDCIDLNAGLVASGEKTIGEIGEEILDYVVEVSKGKLTKAEENGQNDFSIWRLATTV